MVAFWLVLLCAVFDHTVFADVARPPGTGTGPVVAKLHLLGGAGCKIQAGSQTIPAAAGLPLLGTDELVVPVGEFLVVALGNGHVVRIDEDITLRVSEIVLLGVPATRESLTAQLDRLLTKKERVLSERISGVQARRQGAEEMPVETSDPRRKNSSNSRAVPVLIDPATSDRGAALPAPPAPVVQPTRPRPAQKPEALALGQVESTKKASVPTIELPKQDAAKKCLQDALLPTISRVTVEVKLHAGRISRVRLRGGLVTPACLPRLLVKHSLAGAEETWLPSEIVLR